MSFHRWLHNLRSALASRRRQPNHKRRGSLRAATYRLKLEALEDRRLLSTFSVLNLADSGEGSLRQAVLAANVNPGSDAIHFADGLQGTITLTTGQLGITDDLTINGPGAEQLAISGNRQSRIFSISGGATVVIADLTITEGRVIGAPGDGGGILNTGSTLTLDHVILSNNQAIGASGSTPDGRGGAVANVSGATLTVADCQFTGNQAIGGARGRGASAGIFNHSSRLTVRRSVFVANQAIGGAGGGPALGGGIANVFGATATITESTFLGNEAVGGDGGAGIGTGRGGAVYNFMSTLTVEGSAFLGNLARGGSNNTGSGPFIGAGFGGGLFSADGAALFLIGSIVSGNQALGGSNNTSTGGNGFVGTAFGGGLNNVAEATIADCLFENNEARGGSGNRGDGSSFQFVGTGMGGGININGGDPQGTPVSLTVRDVTLRDNRAVGGDGNTAGTIVDAGIGGGLGSNGGNTNFPVSGGSTTIVSDSTVTYNQAIGGRGGAALGGGVANILGGVVTVSDSTLSHNRAQGGEGGSSSGGGLYNGAASTHPSNLGAPTVLFVRDSRLAYNVARGGDGGGDGAGGGVWNGGTASFVDTAIIDNWALGGDAADGSNSGNGFGGGVFNDATASLLLDACRLTKNHANGGEAGEGESDGEGVGGGVYNLGLFDFDVLTLIFENHASTSHNDIFDL